LEKKDGRFRVGSQVKMVAGTGIEPLGYRLMLAQACHGQLESGEKVVGEK
jgi:hypothetical protein